MKKQIIACLVLTMVITTTFGQLTIIPKAGATLSTVRISDDLLDGEDKPKYKIGLAFGAALEIGITEQFAIQPEVLFNQKGWRTEFSENGFSSKSSITLNYLEVPVLIKGKFGNFYVHAGPSIAFGIGGKYRIELSGQGNTASESGNVKFGTDPNDADDEIYFDNAIDFGLQMGGGVKAGPVVIDFRYGLGLSNLYDEEDGFTGDWKIKNGSFQLTVGFPILLGGK